MRLNKLASIILCLGITAVQAEPLRFDDLVGVYRVPVKIDMIGYERPFRTENVLEIIPYRERSFYVNAEINGHHACELSGIAEVEGSLLVFRSVPGEDDPLPACTLSLRIQADNIVFDDVGGHCQKLYCGMNASLGDQSFGMKLRKRIKDPSKLRKSVSYEEAASVYERLLQWRAAQSAPPKQP